MESPSRSAFLFGRATDLALFGGSALLAMGLLAAGRLTGDLNGDAPRWERLVLAGQSQGGGMAAFIAQTRRVAGVIMFSGG